MFVRAPIVLGGLIVALLAAGIEAAPAPADTPGDGWVAAWGAAPAGPADSTYPYLAGGKADNQTVRQIVHLTASGHGVRVTVSNRYGDQPLQLSSVTVAARDTGPSISPGSMRMLLFGGSRHVSIPAGAETISDPAPLDVAAGKDLAVSLAVAGLSGAATWHPYIPTTSYVSDPGTGDHASDTGPEAFRNAMQSVLWLSRVDVLTASPGGAVVAMGDSLTDGWLLPPDQNQRWTDLLGARASAQQPGWSVVNEAISGNRVASGLECSRGCWSGPAAYDRMERDLFNAAGITGAIVLEGTNDLAAGASPANVRGALQGIVDRAHRQALRVVLMTIPPRGWEEPQDAGREAVNDWIRSAGTRDGIVDADALLRDQLDRHRLDVRYDVGDGLHLTAAAMKVLSDSVDLGVFSHTRRGPGYRAVTSDGMTYSFGDAPSHGSVNTGLNHPIVGTSSTPSAEGYWLVASDGGIFAFGDAPFRGSTGGISLNRPIVGMAATPSGNGYWLVASDGGVFAFGDAGFFGSMGGQHLTRPVVGMAATPDGQGYWMVASDGGIFAFGDAAFRGSSGGGPLNNPVVAMARTESGSGYWLVASDGGVFSYGDARFLGSTGGMPLVSPVTSVVRSPPATIGAGYWLVAADGGVFAFGDAPFMGSLADRRLTRPIVASASSS